MEKAWSILEELGAIDEQGKLTALGRHMVCSMESFVFFLTKAPQSLLPIDLRLAKVLH